MYSSNIIYACSLLLCCVYHTVALQSSTSGQRIITYHVNGKKPVHVVSDRFLSFTLDPETIVHLNDCDGSNAFLNMANALTPAYLRIAGPKSNKYTFQSFANSGLNNNTITGAQWMKLMNLISKTKLDVIACLNEGIKNGQSNWDLSNVLEFITFSDKNNFKIDFQLGYELQRSFSDRGKDLGRDVNRLRKILEAFPRYYNNLVIGPDMISFETKEDFSFLRNYLSEAGDALKAFTWHPDFLNTNDDEHFYESMFGTLNKMDNFLWMKDSIFKVGMKGVVPKKSIWIAESEYKSPESRINDSLIMLRNLGVAARMGISVYLRKPHLLSMYEPTSEYWVSALYKSLVGNTVLDTRQNGNNTKLHVFCHCTRISEKPEEGIINPSVGYERGSLTMFGTNTGSEPIRLAFKAGFKAEEILHLYILTENSNADSVSVLMNKQQLGLSSDNELPILTPKIKESPKYIVIPPQSAFFVVLPDAKCRVCTQQTEDPIDMTIKNRQTEEEPEENTSQLSNNVLDVIEDDVDNNAVYVSYPKRSDNKHIIDLPLVSKHGKPLKTKRKHYESSEPVVKYITFSDDDWLSTFPEKLNEEYMKNDAKRHINENGNQDKYKLIATAMMGKRNVSKEESLDEDIKQKQLSMKEKPRVTRSIDNIHIHSLRRKANKEPVEYIVLKKTLKTASQKKNDDWNNVYEDDVDNDLKILSKLLTQTTPSDEVLRDVDDEIDEWDLFKNIIDVLDNSIRNKREINETKVDDILEKMTAVKTILQTRRDNGTLANVQEPLSGTNASTLEHSIVNEDSKQMVRDSRDTEDSETVAEESPLIASPYPKQKIKRVRSDEHPQPHVSALTETLEAHKAKLAAKETNSNQLDIKHKSLKMKLDTKSSEVPKVEKVDRKLPNRNVTELLEYYQAKLKEIQEKYHMRMEELKKKLEKTSTKEAPGKEVEKREVVEDAKKFLESSYKKAEEYVDSFLSTFYSGNYSAWFDRKKRDLTQITHADQSHLAELKGKAKMHKARLERKKVEKTTTKNEKHGKHRVQTRDVKDYPSLNKLKGADKIKEKMRNMEQRIAKHMAEQKNRTMDRKVRTQMKHPKGDRGKRSIRDNEIDVDILEVPLKNFEKKLNKMKYDIVGKNKPLESNLIEVDSGIDIELSTEGNNNAALELSNDIGVDTIKPAVTTSLNGENHGKSIETLLKSLEDSSNELTELNADNPKKRDQKYKYVIVDTYSATTENYRLEDEYEENDTSVIQTTATPIGGECNFDKSNILQYMVCQAKSIFYYFYRIEPEPFEEISQLISRNRC